MIKKIGYLGIPGSYSHSAALEYFGPAVELIGYKSFREVFKAVKLGKLTHGMIPVENSLAGSVYDNYDLLAEDEVFVVGEHYLKIELHLLSVTSEIPPEARVKHMSKIVSHYKALEQTEGFFQKHNWIYKEAFGDTAHAAKFVSDQKDPLLGAIASRETANIYNLHIIKEHIQDNHHNYTRFLVIAAKPITVKDSDKCSIIFTVKHEPGSLVNALNVLSDNHLNLQKIESRPIHGKPFEYLFYVDFSWKSDQESVLEKVLKDFSQYTQWLKVMGYYKAGTIEKL